MSSHHWSDNGVVPSGNKPLSESVLIKVCNIICFHKATICIVYTAILAFQSMTVTVICDIYCNEEYLVNHIRFTVDCHVCSCDGCKPGWIV